MIEQIHLQKIRQSWLARLLPALAPPHFWSIVALALLVTIYLSGCASVTASQVDDWKKPQRQRQLLRQAKGQLGLHQAISNYLGEGLDSLGRSNLRYFDTKYDLNGDGNKETIVNLRGPLVCGTGGCLLLIFELKDQSYLLVGQGTGLVKAPIYLSPRSSNGWRNIIVRTGGGGMPGGYVELRYDGSQYPKTAELQAGQSFVPELLGVTLLFQDSHFQYGKPLR